MCIFNCTLWHWPRSPVLTDHLIHGERTKGQRPAKKCAAAGAISRTEPVDKSAAVMKVLQGNFREG